MFKTRLLSGIVLVILALVVIISGGFVTLFSLLGISLIGMFELYRVFKLALCPERGREEAGCRRVLASLYWERPSEFHTGG